MNRKFVGFIDTENTCCAGKPVYIFKNGEHSYSCECSCQIGYCTDSQPTIGSAIYEWDRMVQRHKQHDQEEPHTLSDFINDLLDHGTAKHEIIDEVFGALRLHRSDSEL